jgi:two-component system LytT family response regulator
MKQTEIPAFIVEDHPESLRFLKQLIEQHCRGIRIVGESGSVVEAAKQLKKEKPGLVFLDVELEDGTGFDLLEILDDVPFALIFTTASDHYAVRAFRFAAIDYLLKPIDPEQLRQAVDRAKEKLNTDNAQLEILQSGIQGTSTMEKLALHTHDRIDIVDLRDIIRCEADGNYTTFELAGGKKILVTRTLKEYDKLLSPLGFLRVHQSHLVNPQHIHSFHKHDGGYLELSNREKIPVSTRRRAFVVAALESLGR